jgi:hypothetical protein
MNNNIGDNNQNGGTLTTNQNWRINGYDSDDTMVDSEYEIPVMGHQNVVSGTLNLTNGNNTSLISRINIALPSQSINIQPIHNLNKVSSINRKSTGKKSNPNSDILKKRNCFSHANLSNKPKKGRSLVNNTQSSSTSNNSNDNRNNINDSSSISSSSSSSSSNISNSNSNNNSINDNNSIEGGFLKKRQIGRPKKIIRDMVLT